MTVTRSRFEPEEALLAAGRSSLAAEVADALRHRCGLEAGARILIGFSGGPDSTALLLLLLALSSRSEAACSRPTALHLDHGLRDESAREADHAMAICGMLGVDCEVIRLELDPDSSDLASRARDARYRALEQIAVQQGVDAVAVGHHAEDRLETMLQSLCRGAGPQGLASPRWQRSLGGTRLVRPLLGSSRAALVALCRKVGVPVVADPTNERLDTARGLLRGKVLDVLEERWPGSAIRASAAADRIASTAVLLERELDAIFGSPDLLEWPRHVLQGLDVEFISAGLRRSVLAHDSGLEDALSAGQLLQPARAASGDDRRPRVHQIGGGWAVAIDAGHVRVVPPDQSSAGGATS